VLTRAQTGSLGSCIQFHTLSSNSLKLVLISYRLCLLSGLFPSGFQTLRIYALLIFSICPTFPTQVECLHWITVSLFRDYISKNKICPRAPCITPRFHNTSLKVTYILQILVRNRLYSENTKAMPWLRWIVAGISPGFAPVSVMWDLWWEKWH
jgi:hypothetical protein